MKRKVSILLPVTSLAMVAATLIIQVSGVFHVRWYSYVLEAATIGLIFPLLGALIVRRHPNHRVGWLFLALGAFGAVQTTMGQSAHWAGGSSGGFLAISSEVVRITGFVGIVLLLLVYPTGRLLSRRWRPVVFASGFFALEGVSGFIKPLDRSEFAPLQNPINTSDLGGLADVLDVLAFIAFVGLLAAVASLIVRFVRARSIERQQIKLFAWSAVASVVLIAGANFAFPEQMESGWMGNIVWNTPLIALPAAAAFAILRHGLYDIDRIISRTLSYAVITTLLAGVFVLVSLVPTAIAGTGDRPDWLIAVATLLVIALFRPVRRRVQGAVDHRFNRARYNAEQTIESFTSHLREHVDIDDLRAELRAVVAQTMQPSHVSLWVKEIP